MKRAIIALSVISSIFYSSESCYYDTEIVNAQEMKQTMKIFLAIK